MDGGGSPRLKLSVWGGKQKEKKKKKKKKKKRSALGEGRTREPRILPSVHATARRRKKEIAQGEDRTRNLCILSKKKVL
jgi:hypothetical protein